MSQDEIKKHEVCKKPAPKDGEEGLQFIGDRVAKVVLSFERDQKLILNTMRFHSWMHV